MTPSHYRFPLPRPLLALLLLLLSLAPAPLQGQSTTNAPADSPSLAHGHSYQGQAFNEGPRQAAYLMSGMPKVHFPITTTNPLTQTFFTQGVGQLHGFWYLEAERSFRQAAHHDTNCPMAYWGMAMANLNNASRARQLIEVAAARKSHVSDREQRWIQALADYHSKTNRDDKDRRRDYIRDLEKIVQHHPDDVEAKAFLVFQIWDNAYRGLPISSAQAVESLLKEIFAAQPMHPAHHYRIHLWDGEPDDLNVRALPSAALCGQSGPGIAHLWHMSGHTFSKLKRYPDMAWQQEAAVRVDNAQIMRDRLLPDQIHNYAHNSEWLCQTYGRVGRVSDALTLARNMIEMPHHPRYNTMDKREDQTLYEESDGTAFHGRRRLLDELVRYELWDDLIALAQTPYLAPTDSAEEQARRARALGLAWFAKGNLSEATNQIAALEAATAVMRTERHGVVDRAEKKARDAKKSTDEINRAMTEALTSYSGRLQTIENYQAELKACLALAQDEKDEARKHLDAARDVPKERRTRFVLALGDQAEAEKLAREAYHDGTNQVQLIANYADILWRAGKTNEALAVFQVLRDRSAFLELDRPPFARLSPLVQHLGLPADWRIPYAPANDIGIRPALDTLGPLVWQPQPAPEWTLPDTRGKKIELSDYRGRPVILLFYLGHSCLHCIEQLNAFAPMKKAFADAGISLVAISSDSTDQLRKTLEKVADKEKFPFPILADGTAAVFKAYRAYDDFEDLPLHGTFLIDGRGLVRWQDISFEPFTEPAFLLKEAQRLLSFPSEDQKTRLTSNRRRR